MKNLVDVHGSDWEVLSEDSEEIKDAIFYRKQRSGESWAGHKIQGIGHDGTSEGKKIVMEKLVAQLSHKGWWVEASDSLVRALIKRGVSPIKNEALLKSLFPSIIKVNKDGSYERIINGKKFTEHVFGNPVLI